MGSEGAKSVTIHVTGFKKFQGLSHNPTETIATNLKSFVEKRGLAPGVTLGSCTVLEVAGDGALPALYNTLHSGLSQGGSNSDQVVWLHLGINCGVTEFTIERLAVNDATFNCPDELGWQPQHVAIVQEDGGILKIRETTCSVDTILKLLKNKGFDVTISDNAGRFVCNYVYYHSLHFAERMGHKSLFVHYPLFVKTDEETRMQFTAALLESIAAACQ